MKLDGVKSVLTFHQVQGEHGISILYNAGVSFRESVGGSATSVVSGPIGPRISMIDMGSSPDDVVGEVGRPCLLKSARDLVASFGAFGIVVLCRTALRILAAMILVLGCGRSSKVY